MTSLVRPKHVLVMARLDWKKEMTSPRKVTARAADSSSIAILCGAATVCGTIRVGEKVALLPANLRIMSCHLSRTSAVVLLLLRITTATVTVTSWPRFPLPLPITATTSDPRYHHHYHQTRFSLTPSSLSPHYLYVYHHYHLPEVFTTTLFATITAHTTTAFPTSPQQSERYPRGPPFHEHNMLTAVQGVTIDSCY
ncbi:hypothetical protein BaRGS_00033371 [Batillaria attramentaria]|uniref:Uncharacterized protein n=1 Tax=Batillaria attramentaria TaxID=370345 RepID=A0ABD0JKP7_9CAEN